MPLDNDNSTDVAMDMKYLTCADAAILAKSPISYIEHLCREKQLSCAYDFSGNFLPEITSLSKILNLEEGDLLNLKYVDKSNITPNENGLPSKWTLKTSRNAELHHEDLPLFPVIAEKKLLNNDAAQLIDNNAKMPLLEEGLVENPVFENKDIISLEVEDNFKLESGAEEVLISSGKIEDNLILAGSKVEDDGKLDIKFSDDKIEPNFNALKENEEFFVKELSTVDNIKQEEPLIPKNIEEKNPLQMPRNPKQVSALRVLPIPHLSLSQPILSEHPIFKSPLVIPISTNTPSLQTKVAAIYTQPDAMASSWLPWMRTSMWSKKKVRKATHNIEISNQDSILPVIDKNSKPNVVYSPVYIPDTKVNLIKEFDNSNLIEPPAVKINISEIPFFQDNNKFVPEKSKQISVVKPEPVVIQDSLDAAFFKGYSSKPIIAPLSTELQNKNGGEHQSLPSRVSPKKDDSWDVEIFS